MKVLIIANYAKEHINKFHIPTIKAFKDMGWQVDVACNADDEVKYCDHIYNLPMERNPYRFQTFKAIKQLKEIIKSNNYDVVHCHTYAGKFIGILAAKSFRKDGLKIVYSAHGFQYYKNAPLYNWLIFMPIDKWLVKNVDLLITSNQEDYETAHKYNFNAKNIVKCCGVGIKTDKFDKQIKTKEEVRKELNIPNDAFVLIYVAELNHNKNQQMLLKAYKELENKIPNLYMLLVGPDHYNGKIQNIIKNNGWMNNIKCLGWRSDIPDLIKASDVAVPSSYREGFGLNILEYMYCKIPVVATNNRGHKETIKDWETGFLVPSNDYELMSQYVLNLYEDNELYTHITENANKIVDSYKEESIVNQIVNYYFKYLKS